MAVDYDKSNNGYPDQAAPDSEKKSMQYGLQVANYIENQHFYEQNDLFSFYDSRLEIESNRLYARGAQDPDMYKRQLRVDGDDSYLNMDWEPVPVAPKFVDLIVNGIQDRLWDVNAYAQDSQATQKRRDDYKILQGEMERKQDLLAIQQQTGVDMFENDPDQLPESSEELDVFIQLNYKQKVEIAAETAINQTFDLNRFDQLRRRINRDLTECGIAVVKHSFDPSRGIAIDYVDPADVVHSYSDDDAFGDLTYVGEIKRVNIKDVQQMFPDLSQDEIRKIRQASANHYDRNSIAYQQVQNDDEEKREANMAELMFFCWKTTKRNIHKIATKKTGTKTAIKRDESFEGPKHSDAMFSKSDKIEEVVYTGVKVIGSDELLLKWELEKNMVRPKSSTHDVLMPYIIHAPNMHRGRFDSIIKRITKYIDRIQITDLKIQQVLQKMVPPGVAIDAEAITEIDLGNGTAYDPREAMNMFFQTGSVIYRSINSEGDRASGQLPIQNLPNDIGNNLAQLIQAKASFYEEIRLATGINEARDASDPDPRALVGVQKQLAANSNVCTRHILDSSLEITKKLAEAIALRTQDVLEFHPLKEDFKMAIGKVNTTVIESLDGLHLHDFGIFLELEPDDEEKAQLEQNIQQALQQQMIFLDDAIDIRQIKNLKLANQVLKVRRQQKHKQDMETQQAQSEAAAQASAQAAQVAEQAKQQTLQMQIQADAAKEQAMTDNHIRKLEAEKEFEKEILMLKHELEVQKLQMQLQASSAENDKNNRAKERQEKLKVGGSGPSVSTANKANTVDGKIKGAGFLQQ